jgi:hypothetical protein
MEEWLLSAHPRHSHTHEQMAQNAPEADILIEAGQRLVKMTRDAVPRGNLLALRRVDGAARHRLWAARMEAAAGGRR